MDEFSFSKTTNQSISGIANLAYALDVSEELIDEALALPSDQRYTPHRPGNGNRLVYRPHPLIRKIQRKIKNRILVDLVRYPRYLYGSLRDVGFPRDYISCAQVHCLSKSVLKIDITKFFDNISANVVEDIYSDFFSFPFPVADALANLCTHEGWVPQGAPTSSHLANLCFYREEPSLVRQLHRQGLRYTRLIDDITISCDSYGYDFTKDEERVRRLITEKGFSVNEAKTGLHYQGNNNIKIHGLRINFPKPQMTQEESRNIRVAVHQVEQWAAEPNCRTSIAYRKLFESTSGRVNKLKRLSHSKYERYRKRLQKLLPLPSNKDYDRCIGLYNGVVADAAKGVHSFRYYRRYCLLQNRLNLIQRTRSYRAEAVRMRAVLKGLKPTYKNDV